jgi:hypothetical protein
MNPEQRAHCMHASRHVVCLAYTLHFVRANRAPLPAFPGLQTSRPSRDPWERSCNSEMELPTALPAFRLARGRARHRTIPLSGSVRPNCPCLMLAMRHNNREVEAGFSEYGGGNLARRRYVFGLIVDGLSIFYVEVDKCLITFCNGCALRLDTQVRARCSSQLCVWTPFLAYL